MRKLQEFQCQVCGHIFEVMIADDESPPQHCDCDATMQLSVNCYASHANKVYDTGFVATRDS